MKTTLDLLTHLRARNIRTWVEGEKLRFRGPEEALTSEVRAELAGRKTEIVEFLRQMTEGARADLPPIKPALRDRDLPLSFSQERLWFLEELDPGSAAYSIYEAVELRGPLEVGAMERALTELVRRHEILRTSFQSVDGVPRQVIHPASAFHLPLIDLMALPEVERIKESRRLATEEAQAPFDLAKGPLFRVKLIRIGEDRHLRVQAIHHIIADDWSVKLLEEEWGTLYAAFSRGRSSPLPELGIQYADYTVWQREWLSGKILDSHIAFWKEQLAGELPVLELPTDRLRPRHQSYRGAQQSFVVPRKLSLAVKAFSDRQGVTPFMTLIAAYAAVLGRYTGQRDLIIGSPVADRNQMETEKLIGFFLSTLLIRTDLTGDSTFHELLMRVREVCLRAQAHREVPYEALLETLRPKRDLSRTPLFQTMFALLNTPPVVKKPGDFEIVPLAVNNGTTKFDLSLTMKERDHIFHGVADYCTDLFDDSSIMQFIERFLTLLEAAVANPQQRLSELPLMAEAERRILLTQSSGETAPRGEQLIHRRFEAQAAANPDAIAIEAGLERLTYGELNARANQLARFLQARGAAPEALVGIYLERSADMLVAMLGILKAGAAYLPLDPVYPMDRLAFMLREAQVRVLVTSRALERNLPHQDAVVVSVDSLRQEIVEECSGNLSCLALPDNGAYVIYTSGSTGRPQGAMISHTSLLNYSEGGNRHYRIGPGDRVLQFHSISFDVSAEEIYPTLTSGATLILRTDEMLGSIAGFLQQCDEMGITVMDLPTGYWHELVSRLEADELRLPSRLRLMIIGGDRALPEMLAIWQKLVGERVELLNTYGPTETAVVATIARLAGVSTEESRGRNVPIGRPIQNVKAYVLDRSMQLAPAGIPGDLYIGGAGLARGYLNRPDVTAAKFVPDPFSGEWGSRLYKTGDVVRFLPNGTIEYIGRTDDQVKIRGFRVEIGEIEAALVRQDGVAGAAVLAREHAGSLRLAAYVVPSPGASFDAGALRRELSRSLPDYMLPSVFVELVRLPLTVNGKLDGEKLPAPEFVSSVAWRAPRTAEEEILCSLFAELLGASRVGLDDSFFELGGHSLLATRLVSRMRTLLGIEMPIRQLFETPTVGGLSEWLKQGEAARPAIQRVERPAEIPLSFAQRRLFFLNRLEGASATYNLPLAVRLHGPVDHTALERALSDVVERHEPLRTIFMESRRVPRQQILDAAAAAPKLRVVPTSEEELPAELAAAARHGFDLSAAPPLRVSLFRLNESEHVLLVLMHHVAADGSSLAPLFRDLATAYAARRRGEAPGWSALAVQYADYAVWQQTFLGEESDQDSVMSRQLAFWKAALDNLPEQLDLPADRARPPVPSHQGANVAVRISPRLHGKLAALARESKASLFMVVQAGLAALLTRLGAGTDIPIGSPTAGRTDTVLEDLVGFFVNTLVLRTDTSGNPSFRELIARVREADLNAYAHQDVPFDRLVELLNPMRSQSRHPLFQIMLTLQSGPRSEIELPGIEAIAEPVGAGVAKFDLTISLNERHGWEGGHEGIEGGIEYSTDLFDESTVAAFAKRLVRLLEAVTVDPDASVTGIQVLDEEERGLVLEEWNRTARPIPDGALPELFAQRVDRSPEAAAVVLGDESLSYRDLNGRANQLAHLLMAQGVGVEAVVAVALPRSVELVVSLLGILKAGAAYLPLDPNYPAARLAWMLDDAKPDFVLTTGELSGRLPENARRILLDGSAVLAALAEQPASNPLPREAPVNPANAAYVMYTSGSTGTPKGVIVTHRGIVRLVCGATYAQLDEHEVILQFSTVSFDASTFEIWGSLLNGGKLVLFPSPVAALEDLRPVLRQHHVTTVLLTTGLFHVMANSRLDDLEGVAQLLVGGDVVAPPVVKKVLERFPECRLINAYGPTEGTTIACSHWLRPLDCGGPSVPIGRPIGNTRVYVLDDDLQPVPIGVPGCLYIAGPGLARGYLNQPGLTAERFCPDPYGPPGTRMYRTGDLAKWRSDGTLSFLGRADHQVKIRGYRIELGEIEAALGQHPSVRDAVVMAREDETGDKRLVAYVAPKQGEPPTVQEFRRFLKATLPDYMLPSVYVLLDSLPLNAHGKVDRAELPKPDGSRPELEREFAQPRTAVEETMVRIWADLLKVDRVGIHDDLFELGGHSLLAMQIVFQVRESFGVELPLRALFDAPTVADLAIAVEQLGDGAGGARLPAIVAAPQKGAARLSYQQIGLWRLENEAGRAHTHPVVIRMDGPLDSAALIRTYSEIVRRHDVLRTRFRDVDGKLSQVVDPMSRVQVDVINLAGIPEPELSAAARRVWTEILVRPFDSAADLPLHWWVLSLSETEHFAIALLSHLVSDGWTTSIIAREIMTLYTAFSERLASPLPDPELQYSDFARWQYEWLQGPARKKIQNHIERLAGGRGLRIPTDYPRPATPSLLAQVCRILWPEDLASAIRSYSRREHATPFLVLLSAFNYLLSRWSGQDDIMLCTSFTGREHPQTTDMIGFFAHSPVLRSDMSGDPDFREVLARVKGAMKDSFEMEGAPAAYLEELAEQTGLSLPDNRILVLGPNTGSESQTHHGDRDPRTKLRVVPMPAGNVEYAALKQPLLLMRDIVLGLATIDNEGPMAGYLAYSSDLFKAETMQRLVGDFRKLMDAVTAGVHRLSEVDLSCPARSPQESLVGS